MTTAPVESPREPQRPLAPPRREASPEARRSFEAALERRGGDAPIKGKAKDEGAKLRLFGEGEPIVAGEPGRPVMTLTRDESHAGQGGGEGRAHQVEARAVAAPDAPAPSQAPTAAEAAHWSAMLDRVSAPSTSGASETHLTLSDQRWLAREAVIATDADGALSLDLSMNGDGRNADAEARRLRERLEARGLVVARIDTAARSF